MNILSDYLLIEIFQKLDDDSLIKASQVCQRWHKLVTESPSIMKQFSLSMIVSHDQSFKVYTKILNGKHQNLRIWPIFGVEKLSAGFYEYLSKYRESVKNLFLQDFKMNQIVSTLSSFDVENITKLVVTKNTRDDNEATVIDIPNLVHLELRNSTEFMKNIKNHRVKVLKISNLYCFTPLPPSICDELNSFLKTCDNLKELTLSNFNKASTPLTFEFNNFKFNLKSLSLKCSIINNLHKFLLSQKNSLVNLAISCENSNVELLKIIFYGLNLTRLEIDAKIMPECFPEILRNSTIKKLILFSYDRKPRGGFLSCRHPCGRIDDLNSEEYRLRNVKDPESFIRDAVRSFNEIQFMETEENPTLVASINNSNNSVSFPKAEKIISICSAVENLSIYHADLSTDDFLTPINHSMKNLRVLKLSNVPQIIPSNIEFEKLTRLEIDIFDKQDNLKNLLNLCRNVKVIKLNNKCDFKFANKNFTDIISVAVHWERIHFGYTTYHFKHSVKSYYKLNDPNCFKYNYLPQRYNTSFVDDFKLEDMERESEERVNESDDNARYNIREYN